MRVNYFYRKEFLHNTAEIFRVFNKHKCMQFTVDGKVKVKVKFTLEQATKAQRESRDIALLFS